MRAGVSTHSLCAKYSSSSVRRTYIMRGLSNPAAACGGLTISVRELAAAGCGEGAATTASGRPASE